MYDENVLGKKPEVASFYGNLTMERVIKDENDHQKTGSLVFRIKRISPKTNDDSGIKCSSSSSDELSTEEQIENSHTSPIKVQIPKTLLVGVENGIKLGRSESNSSEDITIPKEINDSNVLNEGITLKNVETEFANAETKNDDSSGDKTLENVETELVHADAKNDDSNDDKTVKNVKAELVNNDIENCISESKLKIRKRTKRTFPRFEVPIELRRRSSRIVHLRLQKECQQDSSVDVASNGESKCDIKEEEGAGTSCDSNRIDPSVVMKKRQKRKVVPKVTEFKKRKYARPGRPPKYALGSIQDTERQSWPFLSGVDNMNTENGALQPITNSIWTLVPKSLFQSDFFKSQVLEVRPAQPLEQCRFPTPSYYFSPTITHSVPRISNTRVRLRQPRNVVNRVSEVRPKMPKDENSKRPTVIYFKKNFNARLTNQATVINLQRPEFSNKTESTKIHDDLLYLSNKYRMLDEAVVKNCYELNRRSINETDSVLSSLFSSSLDVTSDEVIENVYIKHDTSTNSVSDGRSIDADPNHPAIDDTSPSVLSSSDDTDVLCRNVIVESLKVLFDEQAVLQ